MDKIVVRQHKGRSGRSIFEWRVYREQDGLKNHRFQLAKYRTQIEAEIAAEYYRTNNIKVERMIIAKVRL